MFLRVNYNKQCVDILREISLRSRLPSCVLHICIPLKSSVSTTNHRHHGASFLISSYSFNIRILTVYMVRSILQDFSRSYPNSFYGNRSNPPMSRLGFMEPLVGYAPTIIPGYKSGPVVYCGTGACYFLLFFIVIFPNYPTCLLRAKMLSSTLNMPTMAMVRRVHVASFVISRR